MINKLAVKHPELIYDVGMHRGEDTDYYLKKGFKVIGFEADPELVEYCKNRFSDAIKQNLLTIVEGAIVEPISKNELERQKIKFYKNIDASVWGTICDDWADRNQMLGTHIESIEVNSIDFTKCLERYGIPYFMKIDIEGTDIVCLKALLNFEHRPDYVSIESQQVYFNKLQDDINLLESLGYSAFKAVQQVNVISQLEKRNNGEGKYIGYHFDYGSSGLFGRDLPNEWMNKTQILKSYRKIFFMYFLLGDQSILRKFGVRKLLRRTLNWPVPGWHDTHGRHSSVSP
jgi:FkbM family methyltransferase